MRGKRGVKKLKQLLSQSSVLLVMILFGNTAVNVALSSILEHKLEFEVYILTITIATAVLLFVGEIAPKTIAVSRVEKMSLSNMRLLYPMFVILKPITQPIAKLSEWILKLFENAKKDNENGEEHIDALLSIVSRGSFLDDEEKKLVESVLKFAGRDVSNIMTPRNKMESVEKDAPLDEVIALVRETHYSKIPVHSETDDNIVGAVYLRDLFSYLHNKEARKGIKVGDVMEEIYYVPESKKLTEMLEDFQSKKIRIAAVVDEYGSSIGIVTVSDVLGEIVGEIVDERLNMDKKFVVISKKRTLVAGDVPLDDFNDYFSTRLESDEFDSLAGFVIDRVGDLPEEGHSLSIGRYNIIVRDRDSNHIEKFLVEKKR